MAPTTPDLGKIGVEQGWRGKRGKGGGDGVFPPVAVLVVERARPERHSPGLFLGRPCQFRRQDISHPPSSPMACARAYSAIVRACPRVRSRELGLIHGGMAGVFVAACQGSYSEGVRGEGRGGAG
jgi:hypothetical protein